MGQINFTPSKPLNISGSDSGTNINFNPSQSQPVAQTPQTQPEQKFGATLVGGKALSAQEFLAQPKIKQYAQAFVQTLPKDVYDFFIAQPVEFAKSVAEAVPTLATGGKITPNFGGYVSEAKNAAQNNQGLIKSLVIPAIKTVASGAMVGGEAKAVESGASKFADIGTNIATKSAEKAIAKTAEISTEAFNPTLKGKQLIGAYTQDFGQGATKAGVITKQAPAISAETQRLAKSLSDIPLSKTDNLRNLQKVGDAMQKTEGELTPILRADKTPIVKQVITNELDGFKTNMPREFAAIKDSKNVFNSVIDYGKKVVNNAQPTVNGLRDARIQFDTQAKVEFPSAFDENGFIDTSKPAGRAIKLVRDYINDYAYNTANEGSKIKSLIGRESDLFKAAQITGKKAATVSGKNALQIFMKQHPVISKIVGPILTIEGARRIITGGF